MASQVRPRFPQFGRRQIRTLSGIKRGMIVVKVYTDARCASLWRITRKPKRKKGSWWLKVADLDKNSRWKSHGEISLEDAGVTAYEGDLWNEANCLLRTRGKNGRVVEHDKRILEG